MLTIGFRFLAGRYHANPWGRHVNEADIAWPPEPWRIVRALIATWHLKVKRDSSFPEAVFRRLIENLAGQSPLYHLPPAVHAHTRHYLPQWKAGDTSLVYDAFARVNRDDELAVFWPDLELPVDEAALLDELLPKMGYLGRAESWVEARRLDRAPETNCAPGEETVDLETGEERDAVALMSPLPPQSYADLRAQLSGGKKVTRKLAATLSEDYLQALSVSTADLQKAGWSQPPAARPVLYLRSKGALTSRPAARSAQSRRVDTVIYQLSARPLPRIENAVRVGESLRRAVMGLAKRVLDAESIPPELSGHDLSTENRHGHAFYLPEDTDGNGRIERVLVHAPAYLSAKAISVLERLRSVRTLDGAEWRLLLEWSGALVDGSIESRLLGASAEWLSVTPYLHPWHVKKNFGVQEQLRRECQARGLREPVEILAIPKVNVQGRMLRPLQFRRIRTKRGLMQPDTHGSFLRLRFAQPVSGPLAFGFGCHFGLGLFVPVR